MECAKKGCCETLDGDFLIVYEKTIAGRKSHESQEISLATINSRNIFFQLLFLPLDYIVFFGKDCFRVKPMFCY